MRNNQMRWISLSLAIALLIGLFQNCAGSFAVSEALQTTAFSSQAPEESTPVPSTSAAPAISLKLTGPANFAVNECSAPFILTSQGDGVFDAAKLTRDFSDLSIYSDSACSTPIDFARVQLPLTFYLKSDSIFQANLSLRYDLESTQTFALKVFKRQYLAFTPGDYAVRFRFAKTVSEQYLQFLPVSGTRVFRGDPALPMPAGTVTMSADKLLDLSVTPRLGSDYVLSYTGKELIWFASTVIGPADAAAIVSTVYSQGPGDQSCFVSNNVVKCAQVKIDPNTQGLIKPLLGDFVAVALPAGRVRDIAGAKSGAVCALVDRSAYCWRGDAPTPVLIGSLGNQVESLIVSAGRVCGLSKSQVTCVGVLAGSTPTSFPVPNAKRLFPSVSVKNQILVETTQGLFAYNATTGAAGIEIVTGRVPFDEVEIGYDRDQTLGCGRKGAQLYCWLAEAGDAKATPLLMSGTSLLY